MRTICAREDCQELTPNTFIPSDSELSRDSIARVKSAICRFYQYAMKEQWNTTAGAANMCADASDDFLHALDDVGIDGIIEYYDFDILLDVREFPFEAMDGNLNHWAVRVGRVLIDWTARQFDQRAEFPSIWVADKRAWRNCEE